MPDTRIVNGLQPETRIITGLREIADGFDLVLMDLWGCVHDGVKPYPGAVDTLARLRAAGKRSVLLSNAPRRAHAAQSAMRRMGIADELYDGILTSGEAAHRMLRDRTDPFFAALGERIYHLGPERDRGIFEGLDIETVDVEKAQIVLCSGLYDDNTETPAHYAPLLAKMKVRGLAMICANPDRMVQRGAEMIYCAGAIANEYEKIGGEVIYYGKPKTAIYDYVRAAMKGAKKPLAIGDGMHTDIKGANDAGIEALFIADGVHGEDVAELTERHLAELFAKAGVHAAGAMRALVW